ncbi:MAG: M20/M25/M40 family metallo-hydrolase [Flavobacteriaceae bacterium]|nr:M20/M25/M40 family metallo-hydrolase [Flavobacteriaceae bacterium]MDG2350407.1 M20/M25/M40 family metallo-hydrolase [Flavobacteriaceae bacterium]
MNTCIRNLLSVLGVLIVFNCNSQGQISIENHEMSTSEIKSMVGFLAADNVEGRDTGSHGIEQAALYIEKKLLSYDVTPYFSTYRDSFKINDLEAYNIVGYLEGIDSILKKEVVLIGAHYDHIGFRARPVTNDTIANGANDNASGTATVLAMAKYFGATKNNKRSIIFALFTAEELGLRGSRHLAERLSTEKLNLYTMINFEMMGVPFLDRDYQVFATGHDLSNMAEVLNKYAGNKLVGKSEEAAKFNLFKRSDNYAFYEQFNIAAQTISSCDLTNFDFYHHVDDESDKLDYEHMASVVNKFLPTLERVINSEVQEIKMNNE